MYTKDGKAADHQMYTQDKQSGKNLKNLRKRLS